jgi:hypothetical protein
MKALSDGVELGGVSRDSAVQLPPVLKNVKLGGVRGGVAPPKVLIVDDDDDVDDETLPATLNYSSQGFGMTAPIHLWHERVRHGSIESLRKLQLFNVTNMLKDRLPHDDKVESSSRAVAPGEPLVYGFQVPHGSHTKLTKCDVCLQTKISRKPQPKHSKFHDSDLRKGRVFSVDLKSVPTKTFFGHNGVISFVEQPTDGEGAHGMSFHYLQRSKTDTVMNLQRFIDDAARAGIKIAEVHSDRGTESFEQEGIGGFYMEELTMHLGTYGFFETILIRTVTMLFIISISAVN